MKNFWTITFTLLSMSHALAADLPQIQKPTELDSGEFAEGTITTLTKDDLKEYLPWAGNAKKTLEDALTESKRLPLRERMIFLENEVKSVVRGSAPKKYQQLMRFALNRGLLLVDILEKEADSREIGVIQNQLDILARSIKTSFEFYESDLAFQKRASEGNNTIMIPQAELGMKMAKTFLQSAEGILDASAQFHVMKKTFEILNWDLSQDQESKNYSEEIVEIYKTTSKLPVQLKSDDEAIKHIRTMNYLKTKITFKLREPIKTQVPSTSQSRSQIYQDPKSRLFWSDNLGKMNHEDAIKACLNLKVENKSWRLPTKEEFEEAEKNKIRESLDFSKKYWWSSSVRGSDSIGVWLFNGDNGDFDSDYRDYGNYPARCVAR